MRKINSIIVDEDDGIADRLRSLFSVTKAKTSIFFARNAKEAMAIAGVIPPDVVIMDINLPGKNGIELLKDMKMSYSKTKVIMLADLADELNRRRCKENGADYFFDKATEFNHVQGAVFSLIENMSA